MNVGPDTYSSPFPPVNTITGSTTKTIKDGDGNVIGHFGLSFFLITQSPTLIHRNVLALVDRHLHIRPNWSGRKLYEWPEYCRNPAAASNKNVAVVTGYTIPKQSFNLYHSATQHIKPSKRVPMGFYIFVLVLVITPILGYQAYERIISKTQVNEDEYLSSNKIDQVDQENIAYVSTQSESQASEKSQQINVATEIYRELPTIVSTKYDWDRISACLDSKQFGCVCYGQSAERLMIPLETCKLASKYGWTQTRRNTPQQL